MLRNRYGDRYNFISTGPNTYTVGGELQYWRYGGKEGEERIDLDNLGFADPSGGPFISVGYIIDGRPIKRIYVQGDKLMFEVQE
jgi:hypothetical protein